MPRDTILKNKSAVVAAVAKSKSIYEVLENLGLRAAGGNYSSLHKYAKIHGIKLPEVSGKERMANAIAVNRLPDSEVLCENSRATRSSVKLRARKLIPMICDLCGLTDLWKDKPLKLQLDHINGIHNDHRLENLRWLCPNCHSQTDTFCAKNIAR